MANPDVFNNEHNKESDLIDEKLLESFLEKAEKEISQIEMQEFVNGVSSEELEEKGFIGSKDIKKYEPHSNSVTELGIEFEENVEYTDKKGNDISEIKLESVLYLPDVKAGNKIAKRNLSSDIKKTSSQITNLVHNETYNEKSNIDIRMEDGVVFFVSKVNGKVILFNGVPYIIPSDKDGYCIVKVSSDNMRVTVDMYPSMGNGKELTFEEVMRELKRLGVSKGILRSDIYDYIEKVQTTGAVLNDLLIAEGKNARDGQDADIEFFFQKEKIEDDFSILPDGRIDYRKKTNISIVKKGDLLARIGTPQTGEDGFNVLGQTIIAREGGVPVLIAGENVSTSKDEKEYFAECDGQVSSNGKVLNVFRHYYVDGDVDYRTGNIDFNGNVTIKGSVLEGFEVEASGDIIIMKSIESAKVTAGRDLKVLGGIIGRNGNKIVSCGRDLTTSHLQNAQIEVQRDIFIGNSCIQSTVYCNGKMYLQKQNGVVIGGVVNALCGIEAKTIGNVIGTKTEIVVGNDFLMQKTTMEIRKTLKIYKDNLQKIDTVLSPIMKHIQNRIPISMEKKNRLMMIVGRRKQIKKNMEIMNWKLKDIEERVHADITAVVKVSDTMFPDVTVRINDRVKVITEPCHHITVYYNKLNQELDIGPF